MKVFKSFLKVNVFASILNASKFAESPFSFHYEFSKLKMKKREIDFYPVLDNFACKQWMELSTLPRYRRHFNSILFHTIRYEDWGRSIYLTHNLHFYTSQNT